MKKTYLFLALAIMLAAACVNMPARAQLTSTITTHIHDPSFSTGRDFWFAFPSNEWGVNEGGKYMRIYITSTKNTNAFVASAGNTTEVSVSAYKVASFLVPGFWEMESSGIVENQGIHVYSENADLIVSFFSYNGNASEGSNVIPTIGLGTDYVVAAYGSLYEGATGGYVYDFPSECVIVADENNTVVSITPSCDCRGNAVFPAGQKFNVTLNRGQSMQLMPVMATGPDGFDLTGTIIHSNHPIGVIGGSMEPNIPDTAPYANFVCEMIPPVRTWGNTYYATSFAQPLSSTDDFADYLFIATQPNQTIMRHACDSNDQVECVIPDRYGIYWDEIAHGQKFWSSAPFLVVSYMNSSSYPSGNNSGGPTECTITPRQQFSDTVVFETPLGAGNLVPYYDYCNITCNVKDANNVFLDNKKINGIPAQCIDSNWEIFTVSNIGPGTHTVTGDDSGVGVYIYGYGSGDAYAWSAPVTNYATYPSPDTTAPQATIATECRQATIHLTDTGAIASTLDLIALDSDFNMTYQRNSDWLDGAGADTSGYAMSVVNPADSAILIVSVFDYAGNRTTITTTYAPNVVVLEPPQQNLGPWAFGNPPKIAYDTLYNALKDTVDIDTLHLLYGNVGFSIFDSAGGPLDLSPLAPGERRLIQIQFEALNSSTAVDSIVFVTSVGCDEQGAAVIGSGTGPNFTVTSQTWPNVPLTQPPTCYLDSIQIGNLSLDPITIDSVWWADTVHFKAVSTLPFTLPTSVVSSSFLIDYCPDSASLVTPNRMQVSWFSPQVLTSDGKKLSPRLDSLVGWAIAPSETFTGDTEIYIDGAQPDDTLNLTFLFSSMGTISRIINRVTQSDPTDFINLTGTLANGNTWNPATTAQTVQPGQTAKISVQYPVPVGRTGIVVDYLTAIDGNGDTIGGKPLTATIILSAAGVTEAASPSLEASILAIEDGRSLQIILPANVTSPANFELVNVLGESVLREMLSNGNPTIDVSGLPRGVYFYRITSGEMNNIGKAILGQ